MSFPVNHFPTYDSSRESSDDPMFCGNAPTKLDKKPLKPCPPMIAPMGIPGCDAPPGPEIADTPVTRVYHRKVLVGRQGFFRRPIYEWRETRREHFHLQQYEHAPPPFPPTVDGDVAAVPVMPASFLYILK